MAFMCVKHPGSECDACMECKEVPTLYECDNCGAGIIDGEDYYDINGYILCEDCIDNYKFQANEY